MPITTAIVQARMGSNRLPGKVLMDLDGRPVLKWVVERLCQARRIQRVVVATSTEATDDPIAELSATEGWDVFRGSEHDVLDRFYQASLVFPSDLYVRVTADCPLVDPTLVDSVVEALLEHPPVDYASNVIEPRTYPRGLDVEAFTAGALAEAWRSDASAWREHVTPFLYRNPERFRLRGVRNEVDFSLYRWTVDTPDDLEALRALVTLVPDPHAPWFRYLAAMADHPALAEINREVRQKELA